MRGLSDTSPEAQRVLDAILRAMPVGRKWAQVNDVYRLCRSLHAAGVRSRQPGATPGQILDDWVATHHGSIPISLNFLKGAGVSQPHDFRQTIRQVVDVLDRFGIDYALGGSLASSLHGVSRSTVDADLSVEPFPGREEEFSRSFGPGYYISPDAVRQAVRDRGSFNIIETTTGNKVDVFIRKDRPFERSVMRRRWAFTPEEPDALPIYVVSAEDIILLKLEWYRLGNEVSERQWLDVQGVLRTQAGRLDEGYLDRWAADLGLVDLLEKARGDASAP